MVVRSEAAEPRVRAERRRAADVSERVLEVVEVPGRVVEVAADASERAGQPAAGDVSGREVVGLDGEAQAPAARGPAARAPAG